MEYGKVLVSKELKAMPINKEKVMHVESVIIAKCPNDPSHKTFITSAHEMHDWEVDENGEFIKDLGCKETVMGPDKDNVWICKTCNAEAIVEDL